MISSGVMFSAETKAALLKHNPRLVMVDTLGSSEAMGIGSSRTSAKAATETAAFRLGARGRVITDDGQFVPAGSGQIGKLAVTGYMPLGYYKDPDKTAATFREIDGVRYSIPGDLATVDADGTVRLLGRGSQCINTGGEKVYPEEVEEVPQS
jgi:acyl-coenzyme A synthetase/AMP-(fatty) acid ligase